MKDQATLVLASAPVPAPAARQESEASPLLAMIERVARDPTVDVTRMQALLDMHQNMAAADARRQFDAAFAAMQADIPTTIKRGFIDRGGGKAQRYARWEDINDDIQPILARHGFGLSFRGENSASAVTATAVLSHCGGHREQTPVTLPADNSGGKNAVQSLGSSMSYAKRYAAGLLLNLTSRNEDDDANGGAPPLISDEQLADLDEMVQAYGIDRKRFCAFLRVSSLADLPASRFKEAVDAAKVKAPK